MVAANWKMNTDLASGEKLLRDILKGIPEDITCSVVIAPPFTHLAMASQILKDTPFCLAAQNSHYEASGAFTGEISLSMLFNLDVEYVIAGHSERRLFFHETNEIIKRKVNAIIDAGMRPIFCCGEPSDIRQHDTQNIFVRIQLEEGLFHLDEERFSKVIIAYEPIWAIGTGLTATPEQAQEMHAYIREQLAEQYGKIHSEATKILYGGSIKKDNAAQLFAQDDVDGGLVGGASLDANGFLEIINAACGKDVEKI